MTAKLSVPVLIIALSLAAAAGLILTSHVGHADELTSCQKLQMVKDKLMAKDPNHPGLVGVNNALSQQGCPTSSVSCTAFGVEGTCTTQAECLNGVFVEPSESCATGGCCIVI